MKKIAVIILIGLLISCKAKKAVITEGIANKEISTSKIIENHIANKKNFSSLYIKASASYKDEKQSQNVSAEIKIKKDEKILISVRFLGITMAKALITPKEVKYYDKINGNYFEGNYAGLSEWLGTDLDFQKVQNLLLGQAIDDLKKGDYKSSIENKLYKIETIKESPTNKTFYFESDHFLVKKEEIFQVPQDRKLLVNYPDYKEFAEGIFPLQIIIEAIQKKGKTNIDIDYKQFSFNEELSFPYSVPDGYERIFIK
ncbi:MAG: DUF4292 domain-containing protein [Bacteroidota bacterium]